jgi:hypothetical protein
MQALSTDDQHHLIKLPQLGRLRDALPSKDHVFPARSADARSRIERALREAGLPERNLRDALSTRAMRDAVFTARSTKCGALKEIGALDFQVLHRTSSRPHRHHLKQSAEPIYGVKCYGVK